MAKPALGRGLGNLMKEKEGSRPTLESDSSPAPKPANLSPGMATLLRGNGTPKTEKPPAKHQPKTPAPEPATQPDYMLLKVSLLVADISLVALATCLAFRHGSFGPVEMMLCVIALLLGAWLACLALWL